MMWPHALQCYDFSRIIEKLALNQTNERIVDSDILGIVEYLVKIETPHEVISWILENLRQAALEHGFAIRDSKTALSRATSTFTIDKKD